MLRRTMIVGLFGLILALAACASSQTAATTGVSSTAQGTPGGVFGRGEMPLSMKLPAGTLLLEDTDLAVTPEQAKELLPLWEMVRTLQGSTTASQGELDATFNQIQEAMTPEQLAAIEAMDQEDMRALFQELGMGRQQASSGGNDEETGRFGGPPDMGGMEPPGGGEGGPPMVFGGEGGPPMGPGGFGEGDSEARATAMAGQGGMGLGFGSGLTDAVVELLEARAGGDTAPQEMGPPGGPQEQVATPTATPEPVATPAESPPTSGAVEATETTAPTATPEVESVQVVATATPAVEQSSTAGLEGRFVLQVASGGDIYTVNADGSGLKRVTYGMDPDLSPDGSQIVFVRWTEPWGIYVINVDGSGEKLLFSSNVARSPVWSPDGTQVAFYFQTEGMTAGDTMCMPGAECRTMPGRLQTEWHLGVVDVADGYLHQPYVDRFSFSPAWSADGEWLVYDGGDSGTLPSEVRGLCMTTVEGPNNTVLTDNTNDHYPVWSPDGTKIAFMHWKHDHWEIFIMNADGSDRHALTNSSNYVKPVANNVAPEWSPDGKQIVFLSDRNGEWEFYVMNADGSDQTQILSSVTDSLDIQYTAEYERVVSWAP